MQPAIQFIRRFSLSLMVCLLVSSVAAVAQNLTGEIDGVVRDSSGAVLPGATVTLKDDAENIVVRVLKTDQEGRFIATALGTSTYSVTVRADGFDTVTVRGLEVHVSQQVDVPVVLRVGATDATVTVSASSFAPDTQSSAAGTLLTGTEIQALPLSSRNYQQLLSLQPGISGEIPGTVDRGNISAAGKTNAATFSVNGQTTQQNAYFLDGQDLLNHGGSWQTATFPSIDALQEMQLLRNSYGARYGGGGSGIIAMQTRSGGVGYHGGAWEFFRSQVLNANDYLNKIAGNARPGIRYNDFGYDIGGPVWIPHIFSRDHPKTFFFLLQTFLRSETQQTTTSANVPTLALRNGVFSAPVCVAYTGSKCTKSATTITAIDPTAQGYLTDIINKMPLPNSPLNSQSLIHSDRGFNNESETVIRIDHQFSQRLSVFFRYLDDPFHVVVPYGLYGSSGMPGVKTTAVTDGGTDYLGHATFVLNANTVIDGGYAAGPLWITADPIGYQAKRNAPHINPTLTYPSLLDRVPNITISGTAYTGGVGGPYDNRGGNSQVFLNVTHTMGRHTLYAGMNFESETSGNNTATSNAGAFTFTSGARPAGSAATAFMQAYANFLLGQAATYTQTSANATFLVHTHVYEGYLQDDFRVSSRFTVNGGVRYSLFKQPTVGPLHGQAFPLANFDRAAYSGAAAPTIDSTGAICTSSPCAGGHTPNPDYDTLNGVIVGGTPSSPYGKAVSAQPWLNFAPRVGFALDVYGNGKTALRGGFGIYYVQPFTNATQNLPNNPPNVLTTTAANVPFGNPGGPHFSSLPNALSANETQWKQAYSETYSLDVQQQLLGHALLDVGYYGNRTLHLPGEEDINQPFPGQYVTAGIIPGNVISTSNQAQLNQIRPYLGWGPINMIEPIFASNYNSLQTSFRKHFSGGSSLLANYTWSKSLSNAGATYQSAPQSIYNLKQEYGPTAYQRTHILSVGYVYAVPFFRSQHGFVGHILGGWGSNGIISYASGKWLSAVTTSVDPGGLGLLNGASSANSYPDAIANPNVGAPHTAARWFNTNAFIQVPAGQYRPGNAQAGDILGPGYGKWDVSIVKNIRMFEVYNLQFRAGAFNMMNHTNFTTVSTTLGSSTYGSVTGTGQPRNVQLALKLKF